MIGFLKGKILSLTPETALIETASGVGFEVLVTGTAYDSLAGKKEGEVFTYLQVREDGVSLFGFSSLEEKEIYISAGSACSSNKPSISRTLLAIGLRQELLDSTVRFSFCETTTKEEIDDTLECLAEIIPFRRKFTRK